jgi:hypothetical protein
MEANTMNVIKKIYVHVLTVAIVMVALSMNPGSAVAGVFDFTHGKVAAPGTELHALGNQALEEGLGGISYFTDGEGRVVKVHAKKMTNGDLRVSVKEANIPKHHTAINKQQSLEADRTLKSLETLAGQQPWVGGYAVLPHHEGAKAYQFGVMVESENRRGGARAYEDNRADCCRDL